MPSVNSSSVPKVLLSSTVTTPSLPTLSIAFGDDLADGRVRGGVGGDVRDVGLLVDRLSLALDRLDRPRDGLLDAALQAHRVRAGRDVAHADVTIACASTWRWWCRHRRRRWSWSRLP
jgi:hypothetical protein